MIVINGLSTIYPDKVNYHQMELQEAIRGRRSIRKYKPDKVPLEMLLEMVEAAKHAPTACDRQEWKFVIINDNRIKQRIVDEGAASVILESVGILVAYSNDTDNPPDHIISASLAIQNMLLKAYELGLGTCVVCHLPPKKILRKILSIPPTYDPIAYLCVGYPDEQPRKKEYAVDTTAINEFKWKDRPKKETALKKIGRKAYYLIPQRKHIKPIVDKIFEKKFDDAN